MTKRKDLCPVCGKDINPDTLEGLELHAERLYSAKGSKSYKDMESKLAALEAENTALKNSECNCENIGCDGKISDMKPGVCGACWNRVASENARLNLRVEALSREVMDCPNCVKNYEEVERLRGLCFEAAGVMKSRGCEYDDEVDVQKRLEAAGRGEGQGE